MSKPSAVDMETVVYTEKETSKAAEESMKCKERYSVTHTHTRMHACRHAHTPADRGEQDQDPVSHLGVARLILGV